MSNSVDKLLSVLKQKSLFLWVFLRRLYHGRLLQGLTLKDCGVNNVVTHVNALLSNVLIEIAGSNNIISIGEGSFLNNVKFKLTGNNHRILISRDCSFSNGGSIWVEDNNCSLMIGEKSTFVSVHFALTEAFSQIIVGKDCMFAYDIDVRTGDSHSIISVTSGERINKAQDVYFSDHVWVAAHSIILKGSSIPLNSVVASGAVITKKFQEDGIIIGGNPATVLKRGITWSRSRQ